MSDFVQINVGPAFGTLLAGSWLNTILYSLEGYLVFDRLFLVGQDAAWVQLCLLVAFLSDGACTASQIVTSWKGIIEHWGSADYINVRPTSFNVFVVTTGFTGLLFHGFQIVRGMGMLSSRPVKGGMAGGLGLLSLAAFGTCVYAATSSYVPTATVDTGSSLPNTIWLSATAGLNLLLVVVLTPIYAARRKEQVREGEVEEVSRAWLVTSWLIQSGAVGTVVAIVMLVLSFAVDKSNIVDTFAQSLGRIYTLSLLFETYTDAGALEPEPEEAKWTEGIEGVQVAHLTTVQVEIAHDAPVKPSKIGGLAEYMQPYSENTVNEKAKLQGY